MAVTNDPLHDFAMWDAEQEDKLQQRPICCECGDHIQDDSYYEIEGNIYCPDCILNHKQYF